jgi:hypothetical protein
VAEAVTVLIHRLTMRRRRGAGRNGARSRSPWKPNARNARSIGQRRRRTAPDHTIEPSCDKAIHGVPAPSRARSNRLIRR